MQQDFPLTMYWRHWVFWVIAGILGSGVTTAIVASWLNRRKTRADIEHTDAVASEVRIRAKVAEGDAIGRYIEWLQEAQERHDMLRNDHTSLQDQCADLLNENSRLKDALAQANTDIELKELFIGRLHAATKLGLELKDLPPTLDEVIEMLTCMRSMK